MDGRAKLGHDTVAKAVDTLAIAEPHAPSFSAYGPNPPATWPDSNWTSARGHATKPAPHGIPTMTTAESLTTESILDTLATAERVLPRAALRHAAEHWDEVGPALIARLEAA